MLAGPFELVPFEFIEILSFPEILKLVPEIWLLPFAAQKQVPEMLVLPFAVQMLYFASPLLWKVLSSAAVFCCPLEF